MMNWKSLRPIFQLDPEQARQRWETLTRREREVAEKMARGWTNARIADSLGISPKTLDIHRGNVKTKLKADTAAGIATVFFVVQLADTLSISA